MASAMAAFNGTLKYGSATFASATTICEIASMSISLTREVMDATNRCAVGKYRWLAGALDGEITADLVLNKAASGGSDFDMLAESIIEGHTLDNVWFVDDYNDGFFCSEMIISSLSESQNMGEVIKAAVTLKPNADVQFVLNGALSSGTIT